MQGLSRDQETLMKEAALEVAGTICCGRARKPQSQPRKGSLKTSLRSTFAELAWKLMCRGIQNGSLGKDAEELRGDARAMRC